MMSFEDYSLYTIKAHRLLKAIQEQASQRDFAKASDSAFALRELSFMLYESIVEQENKNK